MENHQSRFTILVLLAIAAAGTIFVVSSQKQNASGVPSSLPKITSYAPPEAKANPNKETTVGAPDGKMTLTVREEKGKELVTYIFLITNETDGSQKEIFRETLASNISISVPYNTFSPDDKYVFLKKVESGKDKYFVLSTAGTWLAKDSAFLEFSSMFESKYPNYKITEATGWGGMNLIVFNVDKASGGQGPSFWFEVPGGGFIQLSNRFN